MRYRLVVLTHGPDFSYLERALASFREMVEPDPSDAVIVVDGPWQPPVELGYERVSLGREQLGFCCATEAAWEEAARPGADYAYYLEHDFVHLREVDLRELAGPLTDHLSLAQMALMRTAVNAEEVAAGGLFESRPGQYEMQVSRWYEDPPGCYREVELPWLRHRSYLTTNPSLMRCAFMRARPWPDYPQACEGRFGLDLVALGYRFGAWGSGEPWVEHVGTRTGFGY